MGIYIYSIVVYVRVRGDDWSKNTMQGQEREEIRLP